MSSQTKYNNVVSIEVLKMLERTKRNEEAAYYNGMFYSVYIETLSVNEEGDFKALSYSPCTDSKGSVLRIYVVDDTNIRRDVMTVCQTTGECNNFRCDNGDMDAYLREIFHEFA